MMSAVVAELRQGFADADKRKMAAVACRWSLSTRPNPEFRPEHGKSCRIGNFLFHPPAYSEYRLETSKPHRTRASAKREGRCIFLYRAGQHIFIYQEEIGIFSCLATAPFVFQEHLPGTTYGHGCESLWCYSTLFC